MDDIFGKVVAILAATAVFMGIPLVYMSERAKSAEQMYLLSINTEFVDSICNTGKIDQTMYWQFISEVSAASGIYQVKIMHEQKELLLSEEQYSYVSTFYDEEDVLSCLMAGEDYVLHRGDYVKVLLLREKSRGTQPFMNSFPWLADSTGNVFYGGTVRYEAF